MLSTVFTLDPVQLPLPPSRIRLELNNELTDRLRPGATLLMTELIGSGKLSIVGSVCRFARRDEAVSAQRPRNYSTAQCVVLDSLLIMSDHVSFASRSVYYQLRQCETGHPFTQGRRSCGPPPNNLLKGPCINRAPPIIKLQHVLPCQSVLKIMNCLYCLNCRKFGQLIIRKIIRIVATIDVKFWGLKCTKFDVGPYLRSLQRSPDPLAAFKGPYF